MRRRHRPATASAPPPHHPRIGATIVNAPRTPPPLPRVLLVGDVDLARHEAAARAAGLQTVRLEPGAEALDTVAMAVLTPAEDRGFRVETALRQGRAVLAPAPVVPTLARAGQLRTAADAGHGCLLVEAPYLYADFAAEAAAAVAELGVVDYVRLQLGVPRQWLAERAEGLLESEALWAPWLLQRLLGPIDTVAAQTRALVRNRPTEDLVLAHLEFVSGAEGAFEAHALGDAREATLSLHVFGTGGQERVDVDAHAARASGLERQYRRLHTSGPTEGDGHGQAPCLDAAALPEALALATWIRQSARLRRRLPRRERPA